MGEVIIKQHSKVTYLGCILDCHLSGEGMTIKVLNNMYEWDQWEQTFSVSTQVSIHSKLPDNEELNLFAISFFELDHEGLIKSATEYWGDT